MKYIDADKLRSEIERRRDFFYERFLKKGIGCAEESRYDECVEILSFIDSLPDCKVCTKGNGRVKDEVFGALSEEPVSDAMKELDEKIAKASKTWEGVDVDEYMDKVRGREPVSDCHDLEEEISTWIPAQIIGGDNEIWIDTKNVIIKWAGIVARHFAEWGAEHAKIDVTDFCKPIDPGIAQCIADHSWEMLGDDEKSVPNNLEEAAENYIAPIENDEGLDYINFNGRDIKDAFIAGAEWQKAKQEPTLTIEDIEKLHTFLYAVKNNKHGAFTFTRLSDGQYEEVLRRFDKIKEQ